MSFSFRLFFLFQQILLDHPLWFLRLHVAEFGVELVSVLRVLRHSFNHFVEHSLLWNKNTIWCIRFVEGLLGVNVVLDAERLEPLERLLRIGLVWVCPPDHIEGRDLVFGVDNDVGEERLVSLLLSHDIYFLSIHLLQLVS